MKTMNYIYRADFYVEFIVSRFAAAEDSRWHMDSDVEFWVIQPCDIKVQQQDL